MPTSVKKTNKHWLDLMKVGGWLTAQEALDWGFVDEICDLPGDVTPKVTAQVIEDLSEAGIPLPFSVQERNDSRVDKIFSLFASFFRSNTQHQQSSVTMNKKFQSIIGCLEIEAIEESDGKFHLSADLMQKLDSHLQEMDSKIKELKETISQKDSELEALRKKPADETKHVVDDKSAEKEKSPFESYVENVRQAKDLFNQIP